MIPSVPSLRSSWSPVLLVAAALAACGDADRPEEGIPTFSSLEEALHLVDSIHLEEVPGDTIAQIGVVDILPDGKILLGDRYLPRVRLYDPSGRFLAGQGRFGEGPFEYQRIQGVAADSEGRVFVEGFRAGHGTLLTPMLEPDTTLGLPGGSFGSEYVARFRKGVVRSGLWQEGTWLHFRDADGSEPWRIPAGPEQIWQVPYWSSVTRFHAVEVGDSLLVANSLLYPVRIYDGEGRLVGEMGEPPPSFRPAPELEPGAFAFTEGGGAGMGNRLRDWLDSFTVVTGLHVVEGDWLVVVHGIIGSDPPMPPFRTSDRSIDVYDLRSGRKVVEDVPLPLEARVLGGGPFLHVLVAEPPEPWTIARFRVPKERAR